jgi:hypothetical protein
MNSEKGEKAKIFSFLPFQLERAVVQFIRNKMEDWRFSDFPKNFRGCGEGVPRSAGVIDDRREAEIRANDRRIQDYSG